MLLLSLDCPQIVSRPSNRVPVLVLPPEARFVPNSPMQSKYDCRIPNRDPPNDAASAGLFLFRTCSAYCSVSSRRIWQRLAPPQTTTSVSCLGAPWPPEFSLTSTLMQTARGWKLTSCPRAAEQRLLLVGWRDTASPESCRPPSSML
jgi:hypothetical protein